MGADFDPDVREVVARVESALREHKGGLLPLADADLVEALLRSAAGARRSVYLLGADPLALAAESVELIGLHPGLRVAGSFPAPLGITEDEHAVKALLGILVGAAPDIVLASLPGGTRLAESLRASLPGVWWVTYRHPRPARYVTRGA